MWYKHINTAVTNECVPFCLGCQTRETVVEGVLRYTTKLLNIALEITKPVLTFSRLKKWYLKKLRVQIVGINVFKERTSISFAVITLVVYRKARKDAFVDIPCYFLKAPFYTMFTYVTHISDFDGSRPSTSPQ